MTPKQYGREVESYRDRREEEEKARFFNTLNAFGLVMAGDKWKWVDPPTQEEKDAASLREAWEARMAKRERKRNAATQASTPELEPQGE